MKIIIELGRNVIVACMQSHSITKLDQLKVIRRCPTVTQSSFQVAVFLSVGNSKLFPLSDCYEIYTDFLTKIDFCAFQQFLNLLFDKSGPCRSHLHLVVNFYRLLTSKCHSFKCMVCSRGWIQACYKNRQWQLIKVFPQKRLTKSNTGTLLWKYKYKHTELTNREPTRLLLSAVFWKQENKYISTKMSKEQRVGEGGREKSVHKHVSREYNYKQFIQKMCFSYCEGAKNLIRANILALKSRSRLQLQTIVICLPRSVRWNRRGVVLQAYFSRFTLRPFIKAQNNIDFLLHNNVITNPTTS